MKRFSRLQEKISSIITKHKQIFLEIRGRETVLAEGYCRIESYNDLEVILSSEKSTIAIRGERLTLRHLSVERIAVEGRIDSVEFL